MNDDHDLQHFVDAQDPVYDQVCSELRQGRKQGHWIWFVFPQIAGLGHSATARRFAIATLQEARAYLQDPALGPRLRECTRLVNLVEGRTLGQIFGHPDDLKFRSSMTLFARATRDNQVFEDALRKYCGAGYDPATLERL